MQACAKRKLPPDGPGKEDPQESTATIHCCAYILLLCFKTLLLRKHRLLQKSHALPAAVTPLSEETAQKPAPRDLYNTCAVAPLEMHDAHEVAHTQHNTNTVVSTP
jgi:hypothetical protein